MIDKYIKISSTLSSSLKIIIILMLALRETHDLELYRLKCSHFPAPRFFCSGTLELH